MCVWNGIHGHPVALADPPALGSQAQLHESRVADHHLLEAREFIDTQIALTGFGDRLAPAQLSVVRWALSFDLKGRLAVFEKEKRRGPANDVRVGPADYPSSLRLELPLHVAVEFGRPADHRAEVPRTREIVSDPVASRKGATLRGELQLGIHHRDGRHLAGVRQVQSRVHQPFVQEPDPTDVRSGRLVAPPYGPPPPARHV